MLVTAGVVLDAQKPVFERAALQVVVELLLDEMRRGCAFGLQPGKKLRVAGLDDAIERRLFRSVAFVDVAVGTAGEVDMDEATWTIPAERMKSEKGHRVPLSDAVLAVLRDVRPLKDGSGLVFPSPQRVGKAMSDMTLTKVLRDIGLADRSTVHGFRTSFRTWASEQTNAEHAVMELCLSHTVGSAVEQAYARSDLFDKRRRLMDRWAAYLGGGSAAKVVRIHG